MPLRRTEQPGIPWLFYPTVVMAGMSGLSFAGYHLGLNEVGMSDGVLINLVVWGALAWFAWGGRKAA